jgi:hypothetical protein
VRLLAVETFEDVRAPIGLAYLWPLFMVPGLDPVEAGGMRAALSGITGFRDLAAGPRLESAEQVAAVQEAWRRWRLSDASRDAKLAAVRQLSAAREVFLERYLVDFALDGCFEVFREAYLVLRGAADRRPADAFEAKLLPRFPRVPDAEVTRANLRSIQDRVSLWWQEWVAERKALLRARAAGGAAPEPAPGPAK